MVVVGVVGVVGMEVVGVGGLWALVGMVSLLLASVDNVIEKPAVSSRGCLNECHSVSCCVAGVLVVPVGPVVLVAWDEASAMVEHCHCAVQIVRALVDSHGTIVVEFLAELLGLVKVGCTKAVAALEASVSFVIKFGGFLCVHIQQVA